MVSERKNCRPRVVMIGAFPPPLHGMAAVNQSVKNELDKSDAKLSIIDISEKNLERTFIARTYRIPKIIRGLVLLLFMRDLRDGVLYMSISGGYGQIYEIFFLMLARMHKMRIFLHHHSFAYLDRPSRITHLLTSLAGAGCIHITLSKGMAERLQSQYLNVCHAEPISNAIFFPKERHDYAGARNSIKTIGFISNIQAEKGVFDFLELVEACEKEDMPILAKIAGPCREITTENELNKRLKNLPTAEYLGPLYGEDKELFFSSIDVVVFPTRYVNEAEPLTIYEALQRGIPVIAYGRGCIPEMISDECGLCIDPDSNFVEHALPIIKSWLKSPDSYEKASSAAIVRFEDIHSASKKRWAVLKNKIIACKPHSENVSA